MHGLQQTASSTSKSSSVAEVVRFNSDEYGNDADNSIEPELKDATKSREIGTQCCVGARYVITKTVATQTEPWQLVNDKIVSEIGVQVDSIQENPEDSTRQHKMNVQCAAGLKQKFFDHCYPSDVEPQSDPFSSPLASCTDESDYESSDGAQSSSSCSTNSDVDQEPQDEQKYIIFKSCLSSLLRHCPSCGSTALVRILAGSLKILQGSCKDRILSGSLRIPAGSLRICQDPARILQGSWQAMLSKDLPGSC